VVYFVDDLSRHSGVYARSRACAVVLQVIASCSTQNAIQAARYASQSRPFLGFKLPLPPMTHSLVFPCSLSFTPLVSRSWTMLIDTKATPYGCCTLPFLYHFIQNLDIRQVARVYIRQPSYSSKTKAFLMSRLPTVLGPETGRL